MTFAKSLLLTVCLLACGLSGLPARAETAATTTVAVAPAATTATPAKSKLPFNEDQKAAMEDFVRNFILDNPEVLIESVNRLRQEELARNLFERFPGDRRPVCGRNELRIR